jgi:hypothetical protein
MGAYRLAAVVCLRQWPLLARPISPRNPTPGLMRVNISHTVSLIGLGLRLLKLKRIYRQLGHIPDT